MKEAFLKQFLIQKTLAASQINNGPFDILVLIFREISNYFVYRSEIPFSCLVAITFVIELEILSVLLEVVIGLC